MKCTQDNEVVLFINRIQLFLYFFIYIYHPCIRELANKVIVHFAAFIFEFTNFQLESRDFSFDMGMKERELKQPLVEMAASCPPPPPPPPSGSYAGFS